MQTSKKGVEFLERHEGVVLKAYRDPVGILTIGAGLTKASGVINPKPGMRISRQEASELLAKSLKQNYEPAVNRTMATANQHEFDGALSFHFNTGAIHRASWVKAWKAKDWADTERRIKLWKKAGGRVLPGLVRRRHEEFQVIRSGDYGVIHQPTTGGGLAQLALALDEAEIEALRDAFRTLGYFPGKDQRGVFMRSVQDFQRDHDLTEDGIIGRATLSTVQRMMDARRQLKNTATSTAAGTAGAGTGGVAEALAIDQAIYLGSGVLVVGLLAAAWIAWRYRDAVAVKVQARFPKIAEKLRGL